jgi:lipoyl(octanoyl) transferase
MSELEVYQWGLEDYETVLDRQRQFTTSRGPDTPDQIWCLQHPPVYTLGLSGRREHLLNTGEIPVCQSDRGGQVTYHGPGQLVMYLLLDLARHGLTVKKYVHSLEQAILNMLLDLGIHAARLAGAPGIYVHDKKLAALGIRIRRGCCYHGISLNVDMDLMPFSGINPCGYPGLGVTQMSDLGHSRDVDEFALSLLPYLMDQLGLQYYSLASGIHGRKIQNSNL